MVNYIHLFDQISLFIDQIGYVEHKMHIVTKKSTKYINTFIKTYVKKIMKTQH